MRNYLIATIKSWNIENNTKLIRKYPNYRFYLISNPQELTLDLLEQIKPEYIFFPHWSWIIPKSIYEQYKCVVFHMTDLPFGRGGSPLQNLIVRGIYNTQISALRVSEGIDAGPVYFKEPFDISEGSADEILRRASNTIFGKMIPKFFEGKIEPKEQVGEIITFSRRHEEQSEIPEGLSIRQLYDYIRMLDGEGYPAAYRKYGDYKIFYTDAKFEKGVLSTKTRFEKE